jgi:hypothetical protein
MQALGRIHNMSYDNLVKKTFCHFPSPSARGLMRTLNIRIISRLYYHCAKLLAIFGMFLA